MTPKRSPQDDFTPADWKALHTAGVARYVKQEGRTISRVDHPRLDMVLSHALISSAVVESDAEFMSQSITPEEFAVGVLHMPSTPRERPVDKKTGVADDEWTHPIEGMAGIIKGRLRLSSTAQVQANVLKQGMIMFSATKVVDMLNPDGLLLPQKGIGYAITRTVTMIRKHVSDPAIEQALVKEAKATRHWGDLVTATPEAAAVLIGALDAQLDAVKARRSAVYARAVAELSPVKRAELEAELAEQAVQRGSYDLSEALAPLPSRSAEESADSAA